MTISVQLPANICDCHVHVFESPSSYPFSASRSYTPGMASLAQLQAMYRQIGVARTVIVQASPYDTDNSCLLDSLDRLDGAGRGVVVIDDSFSKESLRDMHRRGVRGARVNLETVGNSDPDYARHALIKVAAQVADLGWHVQTYTNIGVLRRLTDTISKLPTTLVVDHFGKPDAALGITQPGFHELCDLVKAGSVYVKLTAPYRISKAENYSDVPPFAKALIRANADRVLWGTDWPHPGAAVGHIKRGIDEITPFRDEDNLAALHRAAGWTENASDLTKLMATNAAVLYQF